METDQKIRMGALSLIVQALADSGVPNQIENLAKLIGATLTEAERIVFLDAFTGVYCQGCGVQIPPHCHCQNDE